MFAKHRVNDYGTWKRAYDDFVTLRQEMGVQGASVHRDPEDGNVLTITHKFNDLAAATAFAGSEDLQSAMMRAGVKGPPDIWFTEDIEHTPV